MPAKKAVARTAIRTLGKSRATGRKNSIMNSVLAMPSAHTGPRPRLEFSSLTSRQSRPMTTVQAEAKIGGAAPRQARIIASTRSS